MAREAAVVGGEWQVLGAVVVGEKDGWRVSGCRGMCGQSLVVKILSSCQLLRRPDTLKVAAIRSQLLKWLQERCKRWSPNPLADDGESAWCRDSQSQITCLVGNNVGTLTKPENLKPQPIKRHGDTTRV